MHTTRMLIVSMILGCAVGALALRPVSVVAAPAADERAARSLDEISRAIKDLVRATEKRTDCRCDCRR